MGRFLLGDRPFTGRTRAENASRCNGMEIGHHVRVWEDHVMTGPWRRTHIGRPYRRLRRWVRHTPNGEIATMMMGFGVALVFIAVLVAVFAL